MWIIAIHLAAAMFYEGQTLFINLDKKETPTPSIDTLAHEVSDMKIIKVLLHRHGKCPCPW